MYRTKILFLIGLVICLNDQAFSLSCKNEKGQNVDWFVLLKPPKQKDENTLIASGGSYAYIDNKAKAPGWELAKKDIGDTESAIGKTFEEVYKSPEKYSYIQYNDAKPDGSDSNIYAHAKGALVWTNNEAVWIVHSTPKFLPHFHDRTYDFPATGKTHAQNFLCISLKSEENVNKILNHLVTMKAQIYGNHISSSLNEKIAREIQENINILAKRKKSNKGEPEKQKLNKGEPEKQKLNKEQKVNRARIDQLTTTIYSKGGEKFDLISKSRKDNVDIWFITQTKLKAKVMIVKYWTLLQNAASLLGSSCGITRTVNANDMEITYINDPSKVDWGKNDHSKWSICTTGGNNCYCAGDMNRATSQFKRGGGTVCMHNSKVRETFEKSIKTKSDC